MPRWSSSRFPWTLLCAVLASVAGGSCWGSSGGGGSGGGDPSNAPPVPEGPPTAAEQELNQLLEEQFPEGERAGEGSVDSSIEVTSQSGESEDGSRMRSPTGDGQTVAIGVGYDSPSDPIDAICIAFGSPDNPWCIPTSSSQVMKSGDGMTGAASVELRFPDGLCAQLSQICHDIRCYESAKTSAGTFTESNINLLAYACGMCDEPSCQELLDECEPPGGGGGGGDDPVESCIALCDAQESMGCPPAGDCRQNCMDEFGSLSMCRSEWASYFDCLASNPCGGGPGCSDQCQTLVMCDSTLDEAFCGM